MAWWEYLIPAYGSYAISRDIFKGVGDMVSKPSKQNDFGASAAALLNDREWSEQQAQKQMDFQERMSNTSWQRGIADMQAAGLNPALAYSQGGASSAAGASAQTSSTSQKDMLQMRAMDARLQLEMIRALTSTANNAMSVSSKNAPVTTEWGRTRNSGWSTTTRG